MSNFDLIVLLIVGVAAVGGFMRGLVQEVASLSAWVLAMFAIHYLHTPLYQAMAEHFGGTVPVAMLAFALLLLVPYAGMKLIAGQAGAAARASLLGPIDRVLGFGFGAIKGALITVVAFALLFLGFDQSWGIAGRPSWITTARTYPVVNAAVDQLVDMINNHAQTLAAEEPQGK